eukprot:COSAG05_NODE_7011_length_866_cov_1.312907_1_plen_252_part_10
MSSSKAAAMRPPPQQEEEKEEGDAPTACDAHFAAVVRDRKAEQLRQGRLLGRKWVDTSEPSLRPFAEDGNGHVPDGLTGPQFSWEARRAMYSHIEPDVSAETSAVPRRDLAAYRIGVAGGGFEVFNKIGHDVSLTDNYGDGYMGGSFGIPRNNLRNRASEAPHEPAVVVRDFAPESHPAPPWFPDSFAPEAHPLPPTAQQQRQQQSPGAPGPAGGTDGGYGGVLALPAESEAYPQGSELIMWSEEKLRDFCA